MGIIISVEKKRGCGYRKPGGIYLVGSSGGFPCCLLPLPLGECPCCGLMIRQTRGLQWLPVSFFKDCSCAKRCDYLLSDRVALLWVGEKHYPHTRDFELEASAIGVSKRVNVLTPDFKPGKTWIALAHPKAVRLEGAAGELPKYAPGIFMFFLLQSIDYIVTGQETAEEIEAKEAAGYRCVQVKEEGSALELFN